VVLPLWVVENRPSPLLWPIGLYNSLYYRTSRDLPLLSSSSATFLQALCFIRYSPAVVQNAHFSTEFEQIHQMPLHSQQTPGAMMYREVRSIKSDVIGQTLYIGCVKLQHGSNF